jgi:hypothetical protein
MWSCILACDENAAGPTPVSGVAVLPIGDPTALADFVADVPTRQVLVAAPAALAARTATAVTVAAGSWPTIAIATLVTPHAPLAILSALASARRLTTHPARGMALVSALLATSWSGAWTPSVTRLHTPNPTFMQHLRSYLPGAGFLVRQAPDPAVLGSRVPASLMPGDLSRDVLLSGDPPREVASALTRQSRTTASRQVTLPGSWTSVYGRPDVTQIALVPSDAAQLLPGTVAACPQCDLSLPGDFCPFCRIVVSVRARRHSSTPVDLGEHLLTATPAGGLE